MAEKDDIVAEAREDFARAVEAAKDNHDRGEDDLRFGRLGEQWPDQIKQLRGAERPMLTINKMPAFVRQVVNDARQNKPSIKVHPVDDNADPETARIIGDLIRNIEYTSSADVAYDTATENAVSIGWGFFKIDLDYVHDDTFDMDIAIKRVANPFSIYGDPYSQAADSSDWNTAWETEWMTFKDFEAQFPGEDKIDWSSYCNDMYGNHRHMWVSESQVLVAKWWQREEIKRNLCLMSDGQVFDKDKYAKQKDFWDGLGVTCVKERQAKSWKVTRRIMSGEKALETEAWPGIYIPIVPVYGDEVNVKGERVLRSLIHDAKDAQRQFNYWRTTATELVALSPRVPYIGPKGAFKTDAAKWKTINSQNHQYVEYDGQQPPMRQPMDTGAAAGALQEALNATDDMKAIMGLYDASLGARSNETSGKAIMARQREGDVGTFHFQDNMARAVRHAGRILLDLIPKVYDQERIIRVIGEDGQQQAVPLKQPVPVMDDNGQPQMQQDPQTGQPVPVTRVYDLTLGKYDLTVSTGPSFTSRREEAGQMAIQFVQAFPPAAPIIMPMVAQLMDWPMADEMKKRLDSAFEGQGIPPEAQQQMQKTMQQLQSLQMENAGLKQQMQNKQGELQIKSAEVMIKKQEADTHRYEAMKPDPVDHVGLMDAHTRRFQAVKPEPQPHFDPIDAFRAETERHEALKPVPPKGKP
jgi:hypothetical protein